MLVLFVIIMHHHPLAYRAQYCCTISIWWSLCDVVGNCWYCV